MKKFSRFVLPFCALGLSASMAEAKYDTKYEFLKEEATVKAQLLGADLSAFFRALVKCPAADQAKFDFGTRITEFSKNFDLNLSETYKVHSINESIVPGSNESKLYHSIVTIEVKVAAQPQGAGGGPRPIQRTYTCKTEKKELEKNK